MKLSYCSFWSYTLHDFTDFTSDFLNICSRLITVICVCVCVCVCVYFFLVVFQVPPKTRPWESPSWKTPLGLVYCCLVFILGYSFTNIKFQERRCDKTGLPPSRHESLAGFRVDGGQWGKHTGIFPWNWGRMKRACCVYHHLFPDTFPSVSENITVNNLWRWASQVAQW